MNFLFSLMLLASALRAPTATSVVFDPAWASGQEEQASQADHRLTEVMDSDDTGAAAGLLDDEFTWTERTGKTLTKSEFLRALASLATEKDTDLQVCDFGQVVLLRGTRRLSAQNASVRFARVWIKRPEGWKALIYQETTMAEKTPATRSGFGSPSGGQPVDCENPCKTVPYHPPGTAEKEVVAMWQAVERTVLTNDAEAWMTNFTDDFVFVTPDGGPPLNKADRVAMIKELKRTNTTLIPARVESMKVWVLGDAAVMRSEHKPVHGRTLHITRVFVKRGGHWQITFGQQTAIE